MIGVTSDEGIIATAPLFFNEDLLNEVKTNFEKKFPLMLTYDHCDQSKQDELTKAFVDFYFKNGHDYSKSNFQNFTDVGFILLLFIFFKS